MITSTLSQLHWYKIISPNFAAAIDFALSADLSGAEPGKYEIEGENAFALVNEYITKPPDECDPESHQDYADIPDHDRGNGKIRLCPPHRPGAGHTVRAGQ